MKVRKVGRYEIIEEIGHGGQSVAYKARDPKINRIVAIKQVRSCEGMPRNVRNEFYARFMREAQAAGRLSHPNIAIIYDVGGEEEGEPFMAMEYIDGKNLDDVLERGHPFPQDRTIRIFMQLCSALHYAHQAGIVHRDIKPGNIMIARGDQVKIVDFGIAKLAASNLTQAGTVMGTPSYMSPEQIMGKSVDHRSDIFSLGIVLYETLTGERPFTGDNPTTIIYKIVNEPHQLVRERKPALQPDFDPILSKALAKDPSQRYSNCSEMGWDLERLLQEVSARVPAATRESKPIAVVTPKKGEVSPPIVSSPIASSTAKAASPGPPGISGSLMYTRVATAAESESRQSADEIVTIIDKKSEVSAPEEAEAPYASLSHAQLAEQHAPDAARPAIRTRSTQAKFLWGLAAAVLIAGISAIFLFRVTTNTAPGGGNTTRGSLSESAVPGLLSRAREALGQGLLVGKENRDALYFVDTALAADPSNEEARRLKADIRHRASQQAEDQEKQGKLEEALAIYDALLKHFAEETEIQSKRDAAQAAFSRQKMAAEMEDSRKAGEKAYQAGNFAESIRQFEALAQMDPENAAAFYYLGRSYGNQQNAAKEIEYLSRACKLEPKNPTYNIHLGQALQETKNYAEAIRYFEEGVRLGGDTQHSVATLNKNIGILKSRVALAGLLPYASNVKHDHFIGVGCDGRLTITEKGISFAPVKQKEHALQIGGLETLRSFTIKKNRLDIVLTTGKKYSFDVPDPAPLAKIAAALTAPR